MTLFIGQRRCCRYLHQWSDPKFSQLVSKGIKGIPESDIRVGGINAEKKPDLCPQTHLYQIISTLPKHHFAFGYGSGVVKQAGYKNKSKPQIDIIVGVENPQDWHGTNMTQNSNHYSGLSYFGSQLISWVQKIGAGVYFNPYVDIQGSMVKYGVVSMDTVLKDLTEWQSLYIAGRLQKPVKFLVRNEQIEFANSYNLQSIVNLSILVLSQVQKKSKFNSTELYETIAGISYMGDIRILLKGENPNKIKNIVSKQEARFDKLYQPYLDRLVGEKLLKSESEKGTDLKIYSLAQPLQVHKIMETLPITFRNQCGNEIIDSIKNTVRYPSVIQTMKGLFTAGITKSVKYAWEKISKSRQV